MSGYIQMSNQAIAKIASSAIWSSSEVIAIADHIKKRTDKHKFYKGITVQIEEGGKVSIFLPIITTLRTPLHLLAAQLQANIKHEVELYTNLKVEKVDVVISGIK
ncbi:Asp23/Gls24 family envelope stress response protein [Paenibacillus polymyxa]|uniref:Asp23/Gls24 family envelope stress response protein n=1 Tax=Paenibacillus polymyxa TaxID=1406 RepID=UPI002AB503D1|nr:Asp23/Gls24 family envelope stress response protein [Paenibacillus polymyxa]MDY8026253.1 Asp23/Gls24 family envelope stress response protein [Paenibacillus polymyxa]